MPTGTGTVKCCKDRAVLLTVYVEGPRRRTLPSNNHRHLYLHQPKPIAGSGRGYNRRAELLNYSQSLRQSAKSGSIPPSHPKPYNNQQAITQNVTGQGQAEHSTVPTCLGNWKLSIPSFLKSLAEPQTKKRRKKKKKISESAATKMKVFTKSFGVQKKGVFLSRCSATQRKYW